MFPNHYMDVRLGPGKRSVAYFSHERSRLLILFVHGFSGHAIETWDRMHQLLLDEPSAANADLVFYGYDSTKAQAQLSAGFLRQFIADINSPEGATHCEMPTDRRKTFPKSGYSKILIVAHSLGAALVRRAILDAMKSKQKWVARTELVLFAPAHSGAFLSTLAMELKGSSRIFSALAAIVQLGVPVLQDLRPNSVFLADLQRETSDACRKGPRAPLMANSVVFGLFDRVVHSRSFCSDPAPIVWDDRGHISVCKASAAFKDPLTEVLRHV